MGCCAIDPEGLDIPLETPELLLCVDTEPLFDFVDWKYEFGLVKSTMKCLQFTYF